MNELAQRVLYGVLMTTLYLTAGTLVVAILLRWLQVSSPRLYRAAWACVLVLGWLYLPVSIAIPWNEPAVDTLPQTANGLPPGYAPMSIGAGAPVNSVPAAIARGAGAATIPARSIETSAPAPENPANIRLWPTLLAAAWFLGIVAIVGGFTARYWRLTRLFARAREADPAWQREWEVVLARAGVRRAIPLRVAGEFGPALCRLPRGFVLFVPAELWSGMDAAQREAILMHELAHYRRGDVWKSLAARVLALPHWFNPLAWYAANRFEEAGEWACDEAVRQAAPNHVTQYAQALLSLGEVTGETHALSTAARGRELPVRVRRLLAGPVEDSMTKKLIVSGIAVLIILACAVRFELVAQDTKDRRPANNEAAVARAQEMVKAAEQTYAAVSFEYDISRSTMESVTTWSRRWLDAELVLVGMQERGNEARLNAKRAEAFDKHLKRMEQLLKKVSDLHFAGAQGGEEGRYRATQFFVAEAKLWAEGGANPSR